MNSPAEPVIIQGGMGVAVSDWRLAREVSRRGQLGVVSGTGINTVLVRRLQDGDPGRIVRQALSRFPDRNLAQWVLHQYFRPKGRTPGQAYRLTAMPSLNPSLWLQRLDAMGAFVEVHLAKDGHEGRVGINLLEKLALSNLPVLYGAMLADVDYVLMGAGIPREIPGVLDGLARGEAVSLRVSVESGDVQIHFDPHACFPGIVRPLRRPKFVAIVSSSTLAAHLVRKSTGRVDGLVVEAPSAGGHNAPPRGALRLNSWGEPIYGERDVADLKEIRKLGVPFWLAGDRASHEALLHAQAQGATGVQVGTAFAFCQESGLAEEYKSAVIAGDQKTFTDPFASPTGFPFKVVPVAGSVSEPKIYEGRERRCDLGYLRQPVLNERGTIVYRCPSEPVDEYVRKGGKLEDTRGRKCLCNGLMANVGLAQPRLQGPEPSLVTAGDRLDVVRRLARGRGRVPRRVLGYSASEVLESILTPGWERVP